MSTWIAVVAAVSAAVAAIVAFVGWRESRGDRQLTRIKQLIEATLQPLVSRVTLLEQQGADLIRRNQDAMVAAIEHSLQPLQSQVAVLETKMDVFWRQVAMDAAKILHQPDPRREEVDHLLEQFMEDALSPDEELKLRKILLKIRNWEPGQDVGFPVHPGEQTAAAILLRTMSHAITPRHQAGTQYQGGDPDAG